MVRFRKKWRAVTAAAAAAALMLTGTGSGGIFRGLAVKEAAAAEDGTWAEDPGDAEGDAAAADQTTTQMRRMSLRAAAVSTQEMSPNLLTAAMLAKVGCGYSQANRYADHYFDCSSLVQRCMKEIGITSYVPVSTYDWDLHLKNLVVGDTYVFTGTQGTLTYRLAAKNVTEMGNPSLFSNPGTIMVYIAEGKYSGHVAVSLGSIPRQGQGDGAAVTAATIASAKSWITANYGTAASVLDGRSTLSEVTFDKVWMDARYLGTDVTLTEGTTSGTYNPIWRVEAFNPSHGVCVDNNPLGTGGDPTVRYVLVPVTSSNNNVTAAAPTVNNITVSNVMSSGYDVTATFTAAAGVSKVQMPTWTDANGQDDLIWYTASVSGNTATYHVPTSEHGSESGTYYTHVYVTDSEGRQAIGGTSVQVPAVSAAPTVDNITVSNVTSSGYDVTATFTATAGVSKVQMPTWTDANGQDDLIWYTATVSGNTATYHVPTSEHGSESGTYYTHVYVTDSEGRQAIAGTSVQVPAASGQNGNSSTVDPSASGIDLVFDAQYYLSRYPDLSAAFGTDTAAARSHFLNNGMAEARQASANFNPVIYRSRYADLNAAFGDHWPLYYQHYIHYGYAEGRSAQ